MKSVDFIFMLKVVRIQLNSRAKFRLALAIEEAFLSKKCKILVEISREELKACKSSSGTEKMNVRPLFSE